MPTSRRAVITGIGMVSARGHTFTDSVASVRRGDIINESIASFDAGCFSVRHAAEVLNFDPRPHCRIPKALKLTDRATQFAIAAAAMARDAAAWPDDEQSNERLGVVIGLNGSDLQAVEIAAALRSDDEPVAVDDIPLFAERILGGLNPLWLLVNLPNMPSAHAAIQLRARGPNSTVMTDWIAGSQAIGEAAEWIHTGEADAVLAGGAGTMIQPFALASYQQAGLFVDEDGVAPFVPGEGAAVVLVESLTHARARGASILAEIAGYASAAAPDGDAWSALARTMASALRDATWSSSDIAAVTTASRVASAGRIREDDAIGRVLGECASALPRFDFQSAIGHAAAALGPSSLCLLLGSERPRGGLLCNAVGLSGQAVTLAIMPWDPTTAA